MGEIMRDQIQEHNDAVNEFRRSLPLIANQNRSGYSPSWEAAILSIVNGMELYAALHLDRYDDIIGNDGYFGPAFENMLDSLRDMLNGERGRLDGGLMDTRLRNFAKQNGLEYRV